ncbi:MAG TPA: hypothetical protein PLY86_21865, partial [bacterium]|nr:hypothetical protein [bacterium]
SAHLMQTCLVILGLRRTKRLREKHKARDTENDRNTDRDNCLALLFHRLTPSSDGVPSQQPEGR